jgi:hypothetical protein
MSGNIAVGPIAIAVFAASVASTTATVPQSQAGGSKVTLRITATSRSRGEVTNGGVAGRGRFVAAGAVKDRGTEITYRTQKGALITLRYVTAGRKGTITFIVKIDTTVGTSRWRIASGTKAYRGLHGKGTERENATYTVSTLTGTVWR